MSKSNNLINNYLNCSILNVPYSFIKAFILDSERKAFLFGHFYLLIVTFRIMRNIHSRVSKV